VLGFTDIRRVGTTRRFIKKERSMMPKGWAPLESKKKKTKIGQGKHSKFKKKNSNNTVPKGYRKRYRGQGK
jgi:hypothetical protein